jgi:hypothetical protein
MYEDEQDRLRSEDQRRIINDLDRLSSEIEHFNWRGCQLVILNLGLLLANAINFWALDYEWVYLGLAAINLFLALYVYRKFRQGRREVRIMRQLKVSLIRFDEAERRGDEPGMVFFNLQTEKILRDMGGKNSV